MPAAGGARPKFSFAEPGQEGARGAAPATPPAPPPLTPPRPALGADRGQPPFLRPSGSTLGNAARPPYRPIDPATGYTAPPRLTPQPRQAGYGGEPPLSASRAPAPRRGPALDPYARQPDPRGYGADEFEDDPRAQAPRLSARPPARGRMQPQPPADEYDEVFEDEAPPPRQRASARDYQDAYRGAAPDQAYDDEPRRSSGPWLLLLMLLAAAIVTGGVVWFYQTKFKSTATAPAATSGEQVPVVTAPEQPAKTVPEQPADNGQSPAASKKQIYDRIVGEQEVTGERVAPTEEVPQAPAAQTGDAPAAATANDGTQPATAIPAPDAPASPGEAQPGVTDEPAPLPLPPPPGGDQQGSLDQQGISNIAAAAAKPEQGSTAPPADMAAAAPTTVAEIATPDPLPPPATTADGAANVSGTAPASPVVTETDAPTVPSAPAPSPAAVKPAASVADAGEPEAEPAPPPKKKAQAKKEAPAKKKTQTAPADDESLGASPVVLVPPSQGTAEPVSPIQGGEQTAASESISQQGAGDSAAPAKKKRTVMDLFRGTDTESADSAPAQAAANEETQVAALPPPSKPAQAAKPSTAAKPAAPQTTQSASAGGYVVQLSSFRSQGEAQTEYGRLSQLYPTVVRGLPPRITPASVGGGTRYQLGLGPVGSRASAAQVCSALISAGEPDCVVRGP